MILRDSCPIEPRSANLTVAIFIYEGVPIRCAMINDTPWFLARDISDYIGDPSTFLFTVSAEDRIEVDPEYLDAPPAALPEPGSKGMYWFVSADAVYDRGERRASARAFRRWVVYTVVPAMRAQVPSIEPADLPVVHTVRKCTADEVTKRRNRSRRDRLRRRRHVVYRFFDKDGALLYVGVSWSLAARVTAHQSTQRWWNHVADIQIERHRNADEAYAAEAEAIRTEDPRYNRR